MKKFELSPNAQNALAGFLACVLTAAIQSGIQFVIGAANERKAEKMAELNQEAEDDHVRGLVDDEMKRILDQMAQNDYPEE